ncbi:hypothetical protein DERF_007873 [Dermatophagoides farinae]|uniref:Uncharacterized protein n=1 Tax=Dermatophagoides farinae TaxID=6954 RepID=A0A922I210_DERFA|nr:hypothetical protein DERF_007873 [Dermatophagoides farinae]
MIEYSFAIGGAPRNDEIIARIDLIKVPNFNLWLPRLSLYNCYAWWLDHRMFDSSNVEIIIPAALNVPFSIKDRPFYLYELKHHYQIYLSSLPLNLRKYLERMDHCAGAKMDRFYNQHSYRNWNNQNMAMNFIYPNIEQFLRIQLQKLQSYVERNNRKLREHFENDLDGLITEIVDDLLIKMKNLNETQQKFEQFVRIKLIDDENSSEQNLNRKENFSRKFIRKENSWWQLDSLSQTIIPTVIIAVLFCITALIILLALITFVLFYFRSFSPSLSTIALDNNNNNI